MEIVGSGVSLKAQVQYLYQMHDWGLGTEVRSKSSRRYNTRYSTAFLYQGSVVLVFSSRLINVSEDIFMASVEIHVQSMMQNLFSR